MVEHEWLTIGEAAEYLRLSEPRIYQLVAAGVLVAYSIGRRGGRRYRRSDLDAVLNRVQPVTDRELVA